MALNKPNGDMLDVAGNATPQALGTAAAGTSINCSREDHVHALPTIALGSGVSGTLPVANGGTGQTTQAAAITALTGTQTAGRYLRSDGTNAALSAIQAADVPTLNQNTTGTAAGLSTTLSIASGGTGQTTQAAAITALTGTQTAGRYLRSDGTNAVLSAIQAADVPTLNQNTTGTAAGLSATLAVTSGGTGQTAYTDGQLLIGNSSTGGLTKAAITAGSNVTVTNGNGSISVAAAVGLGTNTFTGTQVWTAGTTSVSPARFQAGVLLSTATAHAIEWDGTSMYATTSTAERRKLLGYTGTPAAGQWLTWDNTNSKFVPNASAFIDGSGNLVINNATAQSGAKITAVSNSALAQVVALNNAGASPTNYFISFAAGSTYSEKGYITWNGTTVSLVQASDFRLKKNIADASSALEKINSIKIRSFDFKEDDRHVDYGVIAQELFEVVPSAVTQGHDNDDGTINKPWTVGLEPLIPILVKAVQELQAKVAALEAR